jgi:hypothetical protein
MGFDDYKDKPKGRGCPVCGEPNVGVVEVNLKEKVVDSTASRTDPYRQLTSRSLSLCEKHATDLFEVCRTHVDEMRQGHGR